MSGVSAFRPEPRPETFPHPDTLPQMLPATLMTMRVSADGGRTWAPRQEVRSTDTFTPFTVSAWPPCECPYCRQ